MAGNGENGLTTRVYRSPGRPRRSLYTRLQNNLRGEIAMFGTARRSGVWMASAAIMAALGSTPASAQTASSAAPPRGTQQPPSAPAFSVDELMRLPAQNWITNGGNLYNQRYSSLDRINRDNVDDVKAV